MIGMNGKLTGWSGFSSNSIEGYVEMQKGLKVAINILTATGDDRYLLQVVNDNAEELPKATGEGAEEGLAVVNSDNKADNPPANNMPASDAGSSAETKPSIASTASVASDRDIQNVVFNLGNNQCDLPEDIEQVDS